MSITRYLSSGSGFCGSRQLLPTHGSITQSLTLGVLRTWDEEPGITVSSGTWQVRLWMLLASPGASPEDVRINLIRTNSSCAQQQILLSEEVTVISDTPTLYTVQDTNSVVTFNPGDRLRVDVRTANQTPSVLLSFDSLTRNSRVVYPDVNVGEHLMASINAVSSFFPAQLEDDLLRGAIGASSALSGLMELEAVGDVNFAGVSQFLPFIETGVFLESLIHSDSLFSSLLDIILVPFPKVIPVSLDGRSRWIQFKLSGTGQFDITIPGFMLYARTEGQDNVEEP